MSITQIWNIVAVKKMRRIIHTYEIMDEIREMKTNQERIFYIINGNRSINEKVSIKKLKNEYWKYD